MLLPGTAHAAHTDGTPEAAEPRANTGLQGRGSATRGSSSEHPAVGARLGTPPALQFRALHVGRP